jgi:hypothetical protein
MIMDGAISHYNSMFNEILQNSGGCLEVPMVAEKATFRSAPDFRHYNGNTDKQADFADF